MNLRIKGIIKDSGFMTNLKLLGCGITIFVWLCTSFNLNAQNVQINEIVASNDGGYLDEDGDSSDWIELFNSTDAAISLEGFKLTDKPDQPNLWTFPTISIPALSYILVFCSGKNRITQPLHTNFKLKSSGEPLVLISADGQIMDEIKPRAVAEGFSLAKICLDQCYWDLVTEQSPGAENLSANLIAFSLPSGVYPETIDLELVHSFGNEIHYTLDGSIPQATSEVYIEPLALTDQTGTLTDISSIPTSPYWTIPSGEMIQVNVIRARAFHNGLPTSATFSKTYGIGDEVNSTFLNYPVFSIQTNSESLFDPATGIYVPGDSFDSTNPQWSGNYFQRGPDWERNVHIEYFENGLSVWAQSVGIRIHGGKTRGAPQKSLRLYARDYLGASKFNNAFFETKSKTVFDKLLLRAHFGCWNRTFIKDEVSAYIARDLDFESQHSRPAVVLINGEYWGLFAIRDYFDSNYIEEEFEIEKDSVDIILNGSGNSPSQDESWGIVEGDNLHYRALIDFMENNDMNITENYAHVATQLDISSTLDYYCSEIFFAQYDWPSNNYKLWRGGEDTKWRYLFYEIDSGWGQMGPNHNTLVYAANPTGSTIFNTPYATFLFRKLLESPEFAEAFQERFACLLKNELSQSTVELGINRFVEMYAPGMPENIDRWHNVSSMTNWMSRVQSKLLNFNDQRQSYLIQHVSDYFDIDFHPDNYDCISFDDLADTDEDMLSDGGDDVSTNIDDLKAPQTPLKIYPNPAADWIWVDADINPGQGQLRIVDAMGNVVYKGAYQFHQKLAVAHLSSGIYFVIIDDGNMRLTGRFLHL